MPELRSTQDLLRVLGDVAASADPIAELKRRGFTFSAEMDRAIRAARPSVRIDDAARRKMARIASKSKVTVRVRPASPPLAAARFAADDFDVIAAVTTSTADQVLNGLHETSAIPRQIPLQNVLSSENRARLATALTGVFTNIPADATADLFTIRGPLRTRAVSGTSSLLLEAPFSLQLRSPSLPPPNGLINGTLSLVVAVTADVQFLANPEIAAVRILVQLPAFPQQGTPALTIDASSPVQPQRPDQMPALALLLQTLLSGIISQSFEVSPFINIPSVPGLRLVVERIDVRTVAAAEGDRIAVGVRFIGAGQAPDLGRLDRLRPEGGRNLALRVHERHFDGALENARRNGGLDQLARKENDKARITSADARFSGNKIIITLRGKVVDACLSLDVGFTVTQTLTLFIENDRLRVESHTDPDVDNLETVICAILAFVVGLAVSLPIVIASPFLGAFAAILIAGDLLDLPSDSSSTTLVPLNRPIPRTELLPRLNDFVARVDDGALLASASLSFVEDTVNTYIYARFLNTLHRFDPGSPLKGARVEVLDQDAPPPPGDDVNLPRTGETERIIGNKFIRTVSVTYEPPARDPVLTQGTTDFDGRVMLVLSPSQVAHGAGHVVTTTTIEDLRSGESESTTTRRPVQERAPDVYFKVFAMGDQEDTKGKPGGLTVNLRTKRLGTPGVPLQFAVRLEPGIIRD